MLQRAYVEARKLISPELPGDHSVSGFLTSTVQILGPRVRELPSELVANLPGAFGLV